MQVRLFSTSIFCHTRAPWASNRSSCRLIFVLRTLTPVGQPAAAGQQVEDADGAAYIEILRALSGGGCIKEE